MRTAWRPGCRDRPGLGVFRYRRLPVSTLPVAGRHRWRMSGSLFRNPYRLPGVLDRSADVAGPGPTIRQNGESAGICHSSAFSGARLGQGSRGVAEMFRPATDAAFPDHVVDGSLPILRNWWRVWEGHGD